MNDAFDIIKVGGICVGAIGLLIAVYQVHRTITWNQMNAALTQFDPARIAALEGDASVELARLKIKFQLDGTLTDDQAREVIDDGPAYTRVKYLLNMLEQNAAAIIAGAIHEEFAFHQMGHYYLRNRKFFDPLIRQARDIKGNPRCWEEMDSLCSRWERRPHAKLHKIV
jgi:hypothetical protein